ncbi:MAG: hypothetical protein GYA17_11545 [Chloroflexi bacterium]|nr:hypothetical protein [Chloroflexota bacterium]
MKKLATVLICGLLVAACMPEPVSLATATPPLPAPDVTTNDTPHASSPEATPALPDLPSQETPPAQEESPYGRYTSSKVAAINYLKTRQEDGADRLYVYRDFSATANHFTQKAKIDDGHSDFVYDMNENWQIDPYAGDSAIEVRVKTQGNSWGGWLFVNGYLPEGETNPTLSFGEVDGAGLDLSGATRLSFMARGAQGGEIVEFFTAGLGYDGESNAPTAPYPDSSTKRSLGFVTLTGEWVQYDIDLTQADLSNIGCGFGFVLSGNRSGDQETRFYLDEIRFEGPMAALQGAPRMIPSYETDTRNDKDQLYIQNAAFSYDNALAAMAFLSEGMQDEARQLVDAFLFAVQNDRYRPDRLRNAYAAGDIRPFPGWGSGTRLPGWYSVADQAYYEDRYQVGTNVGNSSFVALALLQYYRLYGGEEYLTLAQTIMDWVLENCADDSPGFTAGYDGWPEGDGEALYRFTYKSIEHNIDAYAAFKQLYTLTGDARYQQACESAWKFIQSMYAQEKGYFYTGTGNDGVTPEQNNLVLDAQVWSLLSLGQEAYAPYSAALSTAMAMKTQAGGYPFHAANSNGGWWPEGTAFTALALREQGLHDEARSALDAMQSIQQPNGAFPAATVEELSTGFDLFTGDAWTYKNIPHIAPAAWYVMAVNGFNPYAF